MPSLSILMPAYNEERTIRTAIERVLAVDFPCPVEFIVIDDGSTDSTPEILDHFAPAGVKIVRQPVNCGKGAAVKAGASVATGTHVIVLDADLEYHPRDIVAMLRPVVDGEADHVFGARVFGMNARFQSFRFAAGGRATTLAANLIYDSCLTDMHTCLKLLPTIDFRDLDLTESGFGLDTQLTARLLRAGVRPYEVPISYNGRSVAEGKKITWKDGMECLRILIKVRASVAPALASMRNEGVIVPATLPLAEEAVTGVPSVAPLVPAVPDELQLAVGAPA